MDIGDIISIISIVLIVGASAFYLIKAKKDGKKCIGCPYASSCPGNCSSNGCHSTDADNKEE